MYTSLPWIALTLTAFSALLWKPIPRSRGRFRAAFGFLALWLVLWSGTLAATFWHVSVSTAQQVAIALIGLATVQVFAGVAFDFAVEKTRMPRFAAEMVVVACYILIVFNLFYNLGVNVTGIFATSAVAAAVIGLALQDMFANIASGIALEFEDDIRVGDFIKCGDSAGWVQHVRLRHTTIETPDGDRIMLPNSFLTRSSVIVMPPSRRQFIPFSMPYARNPQELIDAVTAALQASPIPDIAEDPANAVALSSVDCYKLDKAGLQGVVSRRSELAEDMSVVLAHRQLELSAVRQRFDLETARLKEAENQMQLLWRIRRFFGLSSSSAGA